MISFILFILKPIICASKLASQPLADSLRQAAIAIGDRYGECFALQVKFLYEYYKPNNFRHFDQSLQAYMDKVLSYGMDRFYFYAVSMKTFYYTREKRYLEGFLYLQEQTKIAESKNNHYGICMLHRMTGVIQHSRGELWQNKEPSLNDCLTLLFINTVHLLPKSHGLTLSQAISAKSATL